MNQAPNSQANVQDGQYAGYAAVNSIHGLQGQPSSYRPIGPDLDNAHDSSTAPSVGSAASMEPLSTTPTELSLTQAPVPSPSMHGKILPSFPRSRNRDGHEAKRVRIDPQSDTPALDSIDYWINFDEDDNDNWGSFEIDFSKLNETPQNRLNSRPDQVPGLGTGLYSSASLPIDPEEYIDDTALENSLSDDEDNFEAMDLEAQLPLQDQPPPTEVPPREGLYSTPLSWERPQLGLRETLASSEAPSQALAPAEFSMPQPGVINLSPAERRRLIAIAMNVSQAPASFMPATGFGLGFGAGMDYDDLLPESDEAARSKPASTTATAKSSTGLGDDETTDAGPSKTKHQSKRPQIARTVTSSSEKSNKPKSADRLAHNDIERKYRTNLKDKIAELRDAVPSLRGSEEETEEGSSSHGAAKLSKGTILMKATEYIHQLEGKNKAIIKEQQQLARRLQAFEALLNATATQSLALPKHSGALFDPRGFC